jgi:protein-disulfide isomerase
MAITRRHRRLGFAIATVAAIALTLTGCSAIGQAVSNGTKTHSASIPTGKKGAVDFDSGFVTIGTGPTTVDTYIDPMCPYCGQFEKSSGADLASLVNTQAITLRIHPLTFLDQASSGSSYSSRASASIACVAANDPTKTLVYLRAMYDNQPEENSTGLTDDRLIALAAGAGADSKDVSSCVTSQAYVPWVQKFNQKALSGGITDADITSIKGTPTILVNGHVFGGDFTDAAAVKAFITGGGASA